MSHVASRAEPMITRQVFPHWSVRLPASFREQFVWEDQYWHAWDESRSISLTSVLVVDGDNRPVTSRELLQTLPPSSGRRVTLPAHLKGWAVEITQPQPARASRAISGVVAVDGNLLLATVTAEDLAWARTVWTSIQHTPLTDDASRDYCMHVVTTDGASPWHAHNRRKGRPDPQRANESGSGHRANSATSSSEPVH